MIDATLDMLRVRSDERVAVVGVVASLFCDDLPEAVKALEHCRDAAREHARSLDGRRQRSAVAIAQRVASVADDLLPPVRQLAKRSAGR